MLKKIAAVLFLGSLFLTGCGKEGPAGPQGQAGQNGRDGIALLAQYANTTALTSADIDAAHTNRVTVAVPEILGRINTTYVEIYYQGVNDVAAHLWNPMSDGNGSLPYASASWTDGKVYLYNMAVGDFYLIKVFQHN